LRILITILELGNRSGTTLYVRDLALQLRRTGHEPVVYAKHLGEVAQELGEAQVFVTRDLRKVHPVPDVIHGHHSTPTLDALRQFPHVPAIYVCHHHRSSLDHAPIHPRLRRYFGVSELCVRRLVSEGMAAEDIRWLGNFVDMRRFQAREGLPAAPKRALVFSNYADSRSHLPAVTAACQEAGLQLDVIGARVGNPTARPEAVLGDYDIVFAKGKAALEAMASGTAVVLCDFGGVGPMVTSRNFAELRPLNFGFAALVDPLTPEQVLSRIRSYDPDDARIVCNLSRETASLEAAVSELCRIYRQVIEAKDTSVTWTRTHADLGRRAEPRVALSAYLVSRLLLLWLRVPPTGRMLVRTLTGAGSLAAKLRSRRTATETSGRTSVR
jgi:hypothetical protein